MAGMDNSLSEEQVEDIVGSMTGYGLKYDDAEGLLQRTRTGPNPYDAAQTFAEAGVTVTHADSAHGTPATAVSGGSVALQTGASSTFYSNNNSNSVASTTWATLRSFSIDLVDGDYQTEHTAELHGTNNTVDEARLRDVTNGVTIFNTGSMNDTYQTYTGTYDVSGLSGTIQFELQGRSNDGFGVYVGSDSHEVLTDFLGGTAFVEWPDDRSDLYAWDVATYTATPDGATVDTYVQVNDGSGWVRANGGDPISRNYGLDADNAVSPGDNVRLEFVLSRPDTASNPTADSAYVSWVV